MTFRLLLPLLLATFACDSEPTPVTCTNIPSGGCPEDNGADVCSDPSCRAVYECASGGWVFQETCADYHPHDASADVTDATSDAEDAELSDVHIDAPDGAFGGSGCVDLEMPDCPAGVALLCSPANDCCGCNALYVCAAGEWIPWGTCADGGITQNK